MLLLYRLCSIQTLGHSIVLYLEFPGQMLETEHLYLELQVPIFDC